MQTKSLDKHCLPQSVIKKWHGRLECYCSSSSLKDNVLFCKKFSIKMDRDISGVDLPVRHIAHHKRCCMCHCLVNQSKIEDGSNTNCNAYWVHQQNNSIQNSICTLCEVRHSLSRCMTCFSIKLFSTDRCIIHIEE